MTLFPRLFKRTLHDVNCLVVQALNLLDEQSTKRLNHAMNMARYAHAGQSRKSDKNSPVPPQPYIIHPLRVMVYLAFSIFLRETIEVPANKITDLLLAAVLHDAIEDGEGRVTEKSITDDELLGPNVAELVKSVTKPKGKMTQEQKDAYIKHIEQASEEVRLLKLADRIDNVSDLLTLSDKEFQKKQLLETRKHFLPLAKATNDYMHRELLQLCNELEAACAE